MAAVSKHVHFFGMGMQIQKHFYSAMVEKDMALD